MIASLFHRKSLIQLGLLIFCQNQSQICFETNIFYIKSCIILPHIWGKSRLQPVDLVFLICWHCTWSMILGVAQNVEFRARFPRKMVVCGSISNFFCSNSCQIVLYCFTDSLRVINLFHQFFSFSFSLLCSLCLYQKICVRNYTSLIWLLNFI